MVSVNARRLVVAVLGAGLVVLGCSSDPKPEASPSASEPSAPTPSLPPSGAPSAAPVPAAAKVQTYDGAIAFLEFFYSEVNRSATAPGTVDFGPLSAPGCAPCTAFAQRQKDAVSSGTFTKEDPVEPTGISIRPGQPKGPKAPAKVFIDYSVRQDPISYYTKQAPTKPAGEFKGKLVDTVGLVRWTDVGWRIGDLADANDIDKEGS